MDSLLHLGLGMEPHQAKLETLEKTFQAIEDTVARDGLETGFRNFCELQENECRKTIELLQTSPGLAASFARGSSSTDHPVLLSYLLLCHYSQKATNQPYHASDPFANSFLGLGPQYEHNLLQNIYLRGDWLDYLVKYCEPTMQRPVNRYWICYHVFLRDIILECEQPPTHLTRYFECCRLDLELRSLREMDEKVALVHAFWDIKTNIDWWAPVVRGRSDAGTIRISIGNIQDKMLTRALTNAFGPAVLETIFQRIAKALDPSKPAAYDQLHPKQHIPIGYQQARALSFLLPNLAELALNLNHSWTENAVICILKAIEISKTIRKLNLTLKDSLFESSPMSRDALRSAITTNTSVVSLITHGSGSTSMDTLMAALPHNTTIQRMEIKVRTLEDPQSFAAHISNCTLSSLTIRLDEGVLRDRDNWTGWNFQTTNRLRSVTIDGELKSYLFASLIAALNEIPLLEELEIAQKWKMISDPCPTNITVPLLQGTKGGTLKKLTLQNVNVKVKVLGKILKKNNHLEELHIRTLNVYYNYDSDDDSDDDDEEEEDHRCKETQACVVKMLQNYNLRLMTVYTVSRTRPNVHQELSGIDYYVALNQLVRKELVDDERPEKLVNLLCRVTTSPFDTSINRALQRFGAEARHVAQYELLRLFPHLWCL